MKNYLFPRNSKKKEQKKIIDNLLLCIILPEFEKLTTTLITYPKEYHHIIGIH